MPCTLGTNPNFNTLVRGEHTDVYKELRAAVKVACELSHILRDDSPLEISKETVAWLMKHEKADKRLELKAIKEEERQKKIQAALDKLTPEDRRLLQIRISDFK